MLITFEGYQVLANRAKDDTKGVPKGQHRNFRRAEDRGATESTLFSQANNADKDVTPVPLTLRQTITCYNCNAAHHWRDCVEECKGKCPRNAPSHVPKNCPARANAQAQTKAHATTYDSDSA